MFKKVKILLRCLYLSLFQLGLRLGCSKFYFKCQNRKNKIKNIIIIFFWFHSGGSFEPPVLQVEPPMITPLQIYHDTSFKSSTIPFFFFFFLINKLNRTLNPIKPFDMQDLVLPLSPFNLAHLQGLYMTHFALARI